MSDLSDFRQQVHEPYVAKLKARIVELKAQRDKLLNEREDFTCGVASALGWGNDGFDGILFVETIRGLRLAHAIEQARVVELETKLPLTADGVRVIPCTCALYHPERLSSNWDALDEWSCDPDGTWFVDDGWSASVGGLNNEVRVDACYSTRELAEAARKGTGECDK